jgi:hypothetical protein
VFCCFKFVEDDDDEESIGEYFGALHLQRL